MKSIFQNQVSELRAGWQIAIFLLAFSAVSGPLIVPLVLLLNIRDQFAMNAAVLVAILISTWLVVKFVNRKTFPAVGLAINKHTMRHLGIGCLIGWLMMTAIFGAEYALGYMKVEASDVLFEQAIQAFGIAVAFFSVAAMIEEVLFRGYPFQTLVRGIKFVPSVAVMSVLFSVMHLGNPNASALGLVNTVLVGVVFCVAYWRTRGLWLPFGIHVAWNFSQTTLYGFPTSGIHFTQYELTKLTQFGPEWITGGAYGPEGGALATLVILLSGVYLYFSRSLQPYPGTMTLEREGENLDMQIFERRDAA